MTALITSPGKPPACKCYAVEVSVIPNSRSMSSNESEGDTVHTANYRREFVEQNFAVVEHDDNLDMMPDGSKPRTIKATLVSRPGT